MATGRATGVAAFNVGDCVVVKMTADMYPGYRGRVIRIRDEESPIMVKVFRPNGRDVNWPYNADDIETDSCLVDQPIAAVRVESGVVTFDTGDCVVVSEEAPCFKGYSGRVVEIRTQEPPIVVRLRARTGRLVRYPFNASQLEKVEPCPDGWPVPFES